MESKKKFQKLNGRPPKADPAVFRSYIRMNAVQQAEFLSLFEQSGMPDKASFIINCIFKKEWKVININKAAMDYYMRLTTFHSQYRAIAVNYNQVVKHLKATFTDKKALAFLYKLENATRELVATNQKVIALTEEFETKYLTLKSPEGDLNSPFRG